MRNTDPSPSTLAPTSRAATDSWLPKLVLAVALVASVCTWQWLNYDRSQQASQRAQREAQRIVQGFEDALTALELTLRAVAATAAIDAVRNRPGWDAYVDGLRLPDAFGDAVFAVAFAERVEASELARHEAAWRRIDAGYRVWPSSESPVRYPLVLSRRPVDRTPPNYGFDPFTTPERQAAMRQALARGGIAYSGGVAPSSSTAPATALLLAVAPVFDASRPSPEQGFAGLMLRPDILLQRLVGQTPRARVTLVTETGETGPLRAQFGTDGGVGEAPAVESRPIDRHGARWRLTAEVGPEPAPPLAGLGELAALLATSAVLYLLARRLDRARVTAQDALVRERSAANERFESLAQDAPFVLWLADERLGPTFMNGVWTEVTGMPAHEALGLGWRAAVHPDDRAVIAETSDTLIRQPAPCTVRVRLRIRDGGHRWFVIHLRPRHAAADRAPGFVGIALDIHDYKSAEEANAESQARLIEVLDAIPVPVCAKDAEGRWLFANRATADFHGVTVEALTGRRNDDLWDPSYARVVDAQDHEARGSGAPVQTEELHRRIGGGEAWVLKTKQFVTRQDGQDMVVVTMVDVSERREARLALERERVLLRGILDSAPASIFAKDAEGRYILLNAEVERFMHVRPETFLGRSDRDFFPPAEAERNREQDQSVLAEGRTLRTQEWFSDPDGNRHWVLKIKRPAELSTGERMVVGWVMDLTDRKREEEELLASKERLALLHRLATASLAGADFDASVTAAVGGLARSFGRERVAFVEFEGRSLARTAWAAAGDGARTERVQAPAICESDELAGTLANGGEVLCGDTAESARWAEAAASGAGAFLAVPVRGRTRPRGVLLVQSPSARTWSEPDRATAAEVADGLAAALEAEESSRERDTALRAAETGRDFLNSLVNALPTPLFVKDRDHRLVLVNDEFALWAGQPRERLIGLQDTAVVAEGRASESFEEDEHAFENPGVHLSEIVSRLPNARSRHILQSKAVVTLGDGHRYVVGTAIPIDNLIAAREQARDSERFLDAILEAVPQPLFVKDRAHRWVRMNQAFADVVGMPREHLLGRCDAEVMPADLAALAYAEDDGVVQTGERMLKEMRVRTPKGVAGWVLSSKARAVMTDGTPYIVGVVSDIQPLREARQRAEDSERFLSQILDALPIPVVAKDEDLRWVLANEAYLRRCRVTREQALGRTDSEILGEVEGARLRAQDLSLLNGSETIVVEEPLPTADGDERWILKTKLVIGGAGERRLILASSIDITERRRAEIAMRRSREFLDAVLRTLPVAVVVKDRHHRYVVANEEVLKFLDLPAQAMIGKSDTDIYDEHTAAANMAEDDRLLRDSGFVQVEQQYGLANGTSRWVQKSKRAVRLDTGEDFVIVSLIDIDERKRAELALESSRQFLDIVLNAIPNSVTVKDEQSRYLMVNRAFADWCRLDRSELVGLSDDAVVEPETAARNSGEDDEIRRTGQSLVFEAHMRLRDGRETYWLKHKTRVDLPTGERYILTVGTDITERKALEAEAIAARQRVELLNRLSQRTLAGDTVGDLRALAAQGMAALVPGTRVCVMSVDEAGTQRMNACAGGGDTLAGLVPAAFPLDRVPRYRCALEQGRVLALSMSEPGQTGPDESATVFADGVRSKIAAPMRHENRLGGIVVVDSAEDRRWTADEIQAVTEVTDALAAALAFRDAALERERAEAALRASTALLDGIINAIPTGIVVKDEQGRWVIGNEAMERLTGVSRASVIGRRNREIYDPEIADILDAEDAETLAADGPVSVEWRVRNPDSGNPWVVKTKTRLSLPDGRRFLISALSDVTTQKEAAVQVERSRRFLDALINALPQAVFVRDEGGRVILANTAYFSLTRRSPEEVIGRTNAEIFSEEAARLLDAQDRQAWDAGHVVYFEQSTLDPRISAEWQLKSKAPVEMPDGSRYLVCTSSDITQLKRATMSVERSKQFVEMLINAVPQGIFVKDEDGHWIMVNEPFLRFGGYKLSNLLGRTNREIYGPEIGARFDEQDAAAWAGGQSRIYEEEAPEAGFGRRWQLKSKTPVRLSDGSRYLVCTTTDVSDRRNSEIELERQRQFLGAILDAVSIPIFVKDSSHRIAIINSAAEAMHRRSRSEVIGKTDYDLHDTAYAEATWAEDEELLAHGGMLSVETPMTFEGQGLRWVLKSKVAATLGDGTRYTVAALLDITERKRAEQQALDAKSRLEAISGISADVAADVRIDEILRRAVTRVAAVLPGLGVSVWSWPRPEAVVLEAAAGAHGASMAPGTAIDVASFPEVMPRLMAGETLVVDDAEPLPEASDEPGAVPAIRAFIDVPIRGPAGAPPRGLLSLTSHEPRAWSHHERQTIAEVGDALMLAYLKADAEAERARVERELRDNEATLRATVWASDLGLWSWDLASNAVYFSPRWKAQIGFAPEELADSFDTWRERVHPEDLESSTAAVQTALTSGSERYQAEFRLRHKDGSWRSILARAQIQRDAQGQPVRMVGGHIDVTDFRRAQEALRRHRDELEHLVAERTAEAVRAKELAEAANLAKSEFLANMSHELRTPMHAILSFSKLGLDRMEAGTAQLPKIGTYLERIQQSGQRLLSLLNDLLDLSKLEAGKMRYDFAEHDLREVASAIVSELSAYARERQVQITVTSGDGPVRTWCDPARIGQVVRNLLSNAVKFTGAGLKVTVEVAGNRTIDEGGIPVEAAMLRVSDEGIGIPDSELEAVFDKFVQSSKTKSGAGGTGLGLAISREIVHQHGGRIWAENNPGRGAAFILLLPAHRRAVADDDGEGMRHVA